MRFQKHLLIIICVFVLYGAAVAEEPAGSGPKTDVIAPPGKSLRPGAAELGFWAGYSPDNPRIIGKTGNRPFYELNLQYARVLYTRDTWALKYTAELIPVAFIYQPRQGGVRVDLPNSRRTIYGSGLSPVGFQLNFRRGHALQPYVNATAGVIYFTEQAPVSHSSQFNFILGLGAGVQIWRQADQSVSIGYKFQHISNGYTASLNPGVDSNLFYLGYSWSLNKYVRR